MTLSKVRGLTYRLLVLVMASEADGAEEEDRIRMQLPSLYRLAVRMLAMAGVLMLAVGMMESMKSKIDGR